MRIGEQSLLDGGRGELGAPGLTVADEEELLVGETGDDGGLVGLVEVGVHVSAVSGLQTTGIGDILTLSQVSVDVESRERGELGVLADDAVNSLLESCGGGGSPPVL